MGVDREDIAASIADCADLFHGHFRTVFFVLDFDGKLSATVKSSQLHAAEEVARPVVGGIFRRKGQRTPCLAATGFIICLCSVVIGKLRNKGIPNLYCN